MTTNEMFPKLDNQIQMKHIDGVWWTSQCKYLDCLVVVKSCRDKGMKAHCFQNENVIFTHRFKWIDPQKLANRVMRRIDLWKSGEWTPIKLRK